VSTRRTRVAAATVPGAVHLRTGRPNQDSVRVLPPDHEGDRIVMAVSDGHGSAASPRSGQGSALAVEITADVLWRLPDPVSEDALKAAVETVLARWAEQVTDHLARHPLTEDERDRSGPPRHATVLYGATLLFAVVSCHTIGVGQLGDGDVVVVDDDGRSRRPLPADRRLLAHETTSLSDLDPLSSVRMRVIDAAGSRLVLLSTDGYANSFSTDDAFLQVGPDLLRTADADGIDSIRKALPGWLEETTRDGAGDDIGVAIAVLDPVSQVPLTGTSVARQSPFESWSIDTA
jgi:serine/threonine protein phosphatase PrpC